jgi:hypothetical protein
MIPALLIAVLAVINTTANLQVPLSVKVTGADQPATGSTTPGFDAATITGLVGLGSAFVYRWKKADKRADTFKDRTTVGAQTAMNISESLRQTDYGIVDVLGSLSKAMNLIPGIPPDAVKLIDTQLQEWKKDNDAYYVRTPAKPTDISSDPVVKKLGEIQKITEKND